MASSLFGGSLTFQVLQEAIDKLMFDGFDINNAAEKGPHDIERYLLLDDEYPNT